MNSPLLALLIERLSLNHVAQFNELKWRSEPKALNGNHWYCWTSSYCHWREKPLLTEVSEPRMSLAVTAFSNRPGFQLQFFSTSLHCHISYGFCHSSSLKNIWLREEKKKKTPKFFFPSYLNWKTIIMENKRQLRKESNF